MSKSTIILILLVLTTCVYRQAEIPKLGNNNIVYNFTDWRVIDHLALHALNELKVRDVEVYVVYIPPEYVYIDNEHMLAGTIVEIERDVFYLYLFKNLTTENAVLTLLHELIHLKQLNSNNLIVCNDNSVEYIGVWYNGIDKILYEERKWEFDAFYYDRLLMELILIKYYY